MISRRFKGYYVVTVHSTSFHVPGRITTRLDKQYSTNIEYVWENGTVRQMNDLLLLEFMGPAWN